MQTSDAEGIKRRGARDHDAGRGYFDNPHFYESADDPDLWLERCTAWASGWLARDAGRDKAVQAVLSVRHP